MCVCVRVCTHVCLCVDVRFCGSGCACGWCVCVFGGWWLVVVLFRVCMYTCSGNCDDQCGCGCVSVCVTVREYIMTREASNQIWSWSARECSCLASFSQRTASSAIKTVSWIWDPCVRAKGGHCAASRSGTRGLGTFGNRA